MFINELSSKLGLQDVVCAYSTVVFDNFAICVEGVKKVISCAENEIRLKVKNKRIIVTGKSLEIKEIGGGEVLVKGEISEVRFE